VGLCLGLAGVGPADAQSERAQTEPKSVRRALLIGVNQYAHPQLGPLAYAVQDAAELAEVLQKAGYEVVLLTDDTGRADPRLTPTKQNIERELQAVKARCQRGDTLLLALAGHGLQFEKQAYFCPQDARPFSSETESLISVSRIYDLMEASFAGTKLVLVDACRNDPTPGRGRGIDAEGAPPPRGVGVLFSCDRGQRAYEHAQLKHGVFFYYVLAGLKGQARDPLGEITFEGLALYVRRNVTSAVGQLLPGAEQVPNLKADLTGIPVLIDRASDQPAPSNPVVVFPRTPVAEPVYKAGQIKTNGMGMKLAYIPPGEFVMGSPESEPKRDAGETPHRVKLTRGFFLSVTEVTQYDYQRVMATNPSYHCATGDGRGRLAGVDTKFFPVEQVSWNQARDFCLRLSRNENARYRLPTEAEWEYACRAETKTASYRGAPLTSEHANSDGKFYRPVPVGRFPANPWGLFDLHGNVSEWTADWFAPYPADDATDPTGPATETDFRVHRGGSWYLNARGLRSAARDAAAPGSGQNTIGFRVLLELPRP